MQFSATSQGPWDARHTAVLFVSAGQSLLTPLQLSATSHAPAEERQTAVLFASAGQAPLVPVQLSAVSQTTAEARHGVPTATLLHAVVLLLGWQDWQLFGAVFFWRGIWNAPPMRHPGMHCIVALFLFGPGGAWQTRPGQHCESFVHFDCASGPACLQMSARAPGTAATVLATSARRAVRQSDFASDIG